MDTSVLSDAALIMQIMCGFGKELKTHKLKPANRGLFYCLDVTPIISHTGLLYEETKMDIEEGYYDCIVEKTEDCDHGPCTAYTAYLNGHAAFTVYLYSDKPDMISIHEE